MWDKASGELRASLRKVFKKGVLGVFSHERFILAASAVEGIKFLTPASLEPVAAIDYVISNGKAVGINGNMLYLGLTDHTVLMIQLDELLVNAHNT